MNENDSKKLFQFAITYMKSGDVMAAIVALDDLLSNQIDNYWRRQALLLRATLFERDSRFEAAETDLLQALEIPNQTENETYSILIALADTLACSGAAVPAAHWLHRAVALALSTGGQPLISDIVRIYPAVRANLTSDQIEAFSRGLKKCIVDKVIVNDLDELSLDEIVALVRSTTGD